MIGTNKEQYRLAATKRYLKLDLNSEQKLDALVCWLLQLHKHLLHLLLY
jgi:hypothetical protein